MKTANLTGRALDYAVAKAQGRAMREPIRATYADIALLAPPFKLWEVTQIEMRYTDRPTTVLGVLHEITVVWHGIAPGCSAPSLKFIDTRGTLCYGSAGLFYISKEEAELEKLAIEKGSVGDFYPSTCGDDAVPIIGSKRIEVRWIITDAEGGGYWQAANLFTDTYGCMGPTFLIAAMRCFVASTLGDEIDIPQEFL